jgi:hypothetical protein
MTAGKASRRGKSRRGVIAKVSPTENTAVPAPSRVLVTHDEFSMVLAVGILNAVLDSD